jgi:hypothetical protein
MTIDLAPGAGRREWVGLDFTAVLGAVLCIVLAILAAVTLRNVRPHGPARPDNTSEATDPRQSADA